MRIILRTVCSEMIEYQFRIQEDLGTYENKNATWLDSGENDGVASLELLDNVLSLFLWNDADF
jgi:hypothetical protein